jgi:hypothetical protein
MQWTKPEFEEIQLCCESTLTLALACTGWRSAQSGRSEELCRRRDAAAKFSGRLPGSPVLPGTFRVAAGNRLAFKLKNAPRRSRRPPANLSVGMAYELVLGAALLRAQYQPGGAL